MTVAELRERLAALPDGMPVFYYNTEYGALESPGVGVYGYRDVVNGFDVVWGTWDRHHHESLGDCLVLWWQTEDEVP